MKKRISAFITAIVLIIMTFALPAYADEITWQDNTENGRIEKNSTDEEQPAEVNDWGGDDFVAKEEPAAETGEEDSASKGMSAEQGTAAALAVAAAGAALLRKRGGRQPEKGGIYITESDRTTLLEKINQIASSTYYIDEDGYLREDKNAPVKEGGSKTYSKLLSGMIDSDKKIILGRDRTYTAGEKEETLEGGIAIGDNGSDQVVIVEEDTNPYTLAHELSHAFRAIHGQRNEAKAEINHDEEGYAILAENKIRYETGAALRTDGDSRADIDGDGIPDGDGSYGQIEGELNLDWIYERQEEMKAASGSIFNFAKKSTSKKSSSSKKSSGSSKKGSNKKSSSSKKSSGGDSSNRTGSGKGSDKNNKSILTRISDFLTSGAERAASRQQSKKTHTEKVGESRSPKRMTDGAKKEQKKALKKIKTTIQKTGSRLSTAGTAAAGRQQSKKTHTEKVGESRSSKQMTKDAKTEQKKAAREAGEGFKDSFKDTACSVKSAGKTLVNATGINGKQKKEQAVGKIYGITRGIGTTIAHPIKTAKGIASGIRKKAKEKGESYVGGYILGEVTQTAAAAGAAAAAGKGLKGAKAAKKTKPKKSNGLADAGSKSGKNTVVNKLTSADVKTAIEKNGMSVEAFSKLLDPNRILTPDELKFVNKVRTDIGLPQQGTVMNKTIPQSDIYNYLYNGEYVGVRGFVSVDEHSNTLKKLVDVVEGNRLDYNNTAFKTASGVDGITKSIGKADTVYGKITYVLNETDGINIPTDFPIEANAPYTGRGFTGSKNIVLPELVQNMRPFVDGDVMGIYDAKTGVLRQQFVYDSDLGWLLK